jgi:HD-like signal output (HDOD) protein
MLQECAERDKQCLTKDVLLSNIPAFPPVVLRALDLLARDRADISRLASVITADATLSAQVLRMANSALFGFVTEIDTVQHAVVALGLSRVQSLIMTVATTNYMRATFRTEALTKCWRHTLASAILSRELARAAGLEPDRAYTFGLLHDIGRLGLLVGYPDAYNEILAEAGRDAVSLLDLEKRRFGLDHCEAGRLLMGEWGLPPEVLVATGRHHDPPQGGPFDMLHVVHLACRFADTLGYFVVAPLKQTTFEELAEMLPADARERLSPEADVRQVVESAIGEGQVAAKPSHPSAPAGPVQPYDVDFKADDCGEPVDENDSWPALGDRQIAWNLVVVVVTVAVFAAVMLGLKFFGNA